MKKMRFTLLFFLSISTKIILGQQLISDLRNISYIGYYNNNLVVLQDETWNLYSIIESENYNTLPTLK